MGLQQTTHISTHQYREPCYQQQARVYRTIIYIQHNAEYIMYIKMLTSLTMSSFFINKFFILFIYIVFTLSFFLSLCLSSFQYFLVELFFLEKRKQHQVLGYFNKVTFMHLQNLIGRNRPLTSRKYVFKVLRKGLHQRVTKLN